MVTQIKGKEKAIKAQFDRDQKREQAQIKQKEEIQNIDYSHNMRTLFQ